MSGICRVDRYIVERMRDLNIKYIHAETVDVVDARTKNVLQVH